MSYFPPIDHRPYNWWTDRKGQAIRIIVVHGTAGTDSRTYLSRGGDRPDGSDKKVSIHCLGDRTGVIYRYVQDERGANHAGAESATITVGGRTYRAGDVNRISLGYELENLQDGKQSYPDAQMLAMGWQIVEWRKLYGSLPVFRHQTIDPSRRYDPVGLTVAAIESWVERAKAVVVGIARVRVGAHGAIAQQDYRASAASVRYYNPGDEIAVTPGWFQSGYYHALDGAGFIPAGQVEPL